jgi:hypothetical protein
MITGLDTTDKVGRVEIELNWNFILYQVFGKISVERLRVYTDVPEKTTFEAESCKFEIIASSVFHLYTETKISFTFVVCIFTPRSIKMSKLEAKPFYKLKSKPKFTHTP